MKSVYALLCTSVLLSELSCRSAAGALPASAVDDAEAGPGGLGLILGDDPMTEPAGVPALYTRSHVLDNDARSEDQGSKIIFVSDARLKGIRGLNSPFSRSVPLLAERSLSRSPAEPSVKYERRNTDLDMLRCMIGRVYRPCWDSQP